MLRRERGGIVSNCAYEVKKLLFDIGCGNYWNDQDYISVSFQEIKQRLLDIFVQNLKSEINISPKLYVFSQIKDDFVCSSYLDNIQNKRLRSTLTKIRISAHDLNIERGRYFNIPREML